MDQQKNLNQSQVSQAPKPPQENKSKFKLSYNEKRNRMRRPVSAIWAVLIGLGVGVLLFTMASPTHNPLLFVQDLIMGSFGSVRSVGVLISSFAWLCLAGLAVAVAFRAGWFNIGVAGQFIFGGIIAYLVIWGVDIQSGAEKDYLNAIHTTDVDDTTTGIQMAFGNDAAAMAAYDGYNVGTVIEPVLALTCGAAAGMSLAALTTWLKLRFNVHEVLSAIMINWIVTYFYIWLLHSSGLAADGVNSLGQAFIDPNTGATTNIINVGTNADAITQADTGSLYSPWLSNIFGTAMTWGILIAIAMIVVCWYIFKKSTFGYRIDVIGKNRDAATYAGISVKKNMYSIMMISGMLAGLGGVIYYTSIQGQLVNIDAIVPAQGFQGIAIALIGFSDPLIIMASTFLVAVLVSAGDFLQQDIGNPYLVSMIIGTTVLTIACANYFFEKDPLGNKKIRKILTMQKGYRDEYTLNGALKADAVGGVDPSVHYKMAKNLYWVALVQDNNELIKHYELVLDKWDAYEANGDTKSLEDVVKMIAFEDSYVQKANEAEAAQKVATAANVVKAVAPKAPVAKTTTAKGGGK